MNKLAKIELPKPERRAPGRPKKTFDLRKLDLLKVALPESIERSLEDLFIFDARSIDAATRRELLRLLPQLTHVRRAWKAHFVEHGCVSCHRKKVVYQSGGFCERCQGRICGRMRTALRLIGNGRNTPDEIAALSRKFDAAQMLLGGEQ
jgi:hypothetical protein